MRKIILINTKVENQRKVIDKLALNKFVYEYAKAHIYISKKMLAGMYSIKQNPSTTINMIKRKVANIFQVYYKLGIARQYGTNTAKINREKLKRFNPEELAELTIGNFRSYKKIKTPSFCPICKREFETKMGLKVHQTKSRCNNKIVVLL